MINLFEYAFQQGCGLRLEEVLRNPRYTELEQRFRQAPALESTERTLGALGHLVAGRLLNSCSEEEALEKAKSEPHGTFGHGKELLPLIELLGESLITAAQKCLPAEVVELASEWREVDADRQIEMSKLLTQIFVSTSQISEKDYGMSALQDEISHRMWALMDHRIEPVLPLQYGPWNPQSCMANCQGKTQMIAAFAQLAGARCLVVSPVVLVRDVQSAARNRIGDMVSDDLSARDLLDADEGFADGVRAFRISRSLPDIDKFFHAGLAIEVRDCRWVLVDPHVVSWGLFGPEWDMGQVCAALQRYATALPGLSLMRHDHGALQTHLKQSFAAAEDLIARSRRAQEVIAGMEGPDRFFALVRHINECDDLEALLVHEAAEQGCAPVEFRSFEDRQVAIMMMITCSTSLGDLFDVPMRVMVEPGYASRCIGKWLTYYHATAQNILGPRIHYDGKAVHPVCEFSRPAYSLAMSVLNSVSILSGSRGDATDRFFLDYAFDQTSLFNALTSVYTRSRGREIEQAALKAAQALPFRHELMERKIKKGW